MNGRCLTICVFCFCVFFLMLGINIGQNNQVHAQDREKIAPELTLAERESFENLKVQDLQFKITLDNIRQKYQTKLEQDPEYVANVRKKGDVDERLNVMYVELIKRADPKLWILDVDSLKFLPVAVPPKEKK